MYLRFIAPAAPGRRLVTRSRVEPGLFGPAGDLWWSDTPLSPTLVAMRRELDWFNQHLPVPTRLGVRARRVRWNDGVCWFRDSAREMLRHAHVLASLIEDCGIRIDRICARDPGQILYRDDWQVVAMPERYRLSRRRENASASPPASDRPRMRRFLVGVLAA